MKRILTLLLILALVFSLQAPIGVAHAEEITPRFTHTQEVYASIEVNWFWGTAYCQGHCEAINLSAPVSVVVYLERYDTQAMCWHTISTWTTHGIGQALAAGSEAITRTDSYRVRTEGYIYDEISQLLEFVEAIDYYFP